MRKQTHLFAAFAIVLAASPALAQTAEICGNGLDDDGDGFADEGCYPGLTNPLVDSPLSTADTGLISPSKGALYYAMPPDIAAKVPHGAGLSFRRTYVSMNNPGTSPPPYRKPMGDRWIHNYMGWIDDRVDTITIHMPSGQEIQARNVGSCNYEVHGGQAVKSLSHCSTSSWTLTMLDGSRLVWEDNFGKPRLSNICAAGTSGCLYISYTASSQWQVSDVSDATFHRNLHFTYTNNLLTSIELQVDGVTQHTTSYSYTGSNLSSVTIGSQLAQQNSYTSNYLTQIADGAGNVMVKFAYDAATAGKAVRIDTPRGMVGFEFAATRTSCSGSNKTVLYFNRANTTTCTSDTDCGTGNMCGGKTGSGATGQCFRAARCLTVDLTAGHHEDVVTTVAALAPSGQTCDGACLDVSQYFWSNSTTFVASLGTLDPTGNYTVRSVNTNGLPTEITFGDPDNNSSNLNSNRTMWLYYNDVNFPGLVTEIRRRSDLDPNASSCNRDNATGCQRTQIAYNPFRAKPATVSVQGTTYTTSGTTTSFNFVTTYTYDSVGRVTQIDGPLAGSNDVAVFEYWDDPSNGFRDGFLQNLKRKRDATTFVVSSALVYDARGNPTTLQGSDTDATHSTGSLTCLTFDAARGYLSEVRKAMAGQTDCSTPNGADISTAYDRDSALRLTSRSRPDGSCMIYEYGHAESGRPVHLLRTKRRDDCLAGSSGDRQEYVYDAEGLVIEVQTYDAASVLTAKQPYTYFDSRKLQNIVNPVDTSKWTGITYDDRGLVSQVDAPGGIGKTVYRRDPAQLPGRDGRVTSEDRYKDASTFDTWNLLYDWLGNQFRVTDGDSKATETTRDDLGRVVKLVSPDMTHPTVYAFDGAHDGTQTDTVIEAFGSGTPLSHSFTFDNIGRLVTGEYQGTCPTGTPHAEVIRQYDAPPSCPSGMTCGRTGGRLAYVKVTLMCSSAYADGALDQETWFSYDDAGRLVREYIKDDTGRIADHLYAWTKNGALAQVTTPSGAALGRTFGSTGSNSDTDRVTALWRTNASTPVIDAILWNPYGPLQQYNQQNKVSNKLQRTVIARNLAYRITSIAVENQTNGNDTFSVSIAEDAKGRVTKRDYSNAASGVEDSYFLYDHQDRVLCETTNLVSSCPTSGSNIKNSRTSPYFTAAGDWNQLLRPVPGSTGGLMNSFNPSGYGTSHQVTMVRQNDGSPALGDTVLAYDARGNRTSDDNTSTLTNDRRDYTYDQRGNVINVHGKYFTGAVWHDYDVASAFDAKNRRVFKSFLDNATGVQAQWFFYYDPLDRLIEVRYTPNTASSDYAVFQVFWLRDRLVLYWQTDYPTATTTRRYVGSDETGRPLDMWTWPASGNGSRVWAVDPSAWAFDTNKVGPTVFQPILFAGQYSDPDTGALENSGTTVHRSGVALNGFRTYDPFTGAYLQVDPLVPETRSSYGYVDSNPIGNKDPLGLKYWVETGSNSVSLCNDERPPICVPSFTVDKNGNIVEGEVCEKPLHCDFTIIDKFPGPGVGGGGGDWLPPGGGGGGVGPAIGIGIGVLIGCLVDPIACTGITITLAPTDDDDDDDSDWLNRGGRPTKRKDDPNSDPDNGNYPYCRMQLDGCLLQQAYKGTVPCGDCFEECIKGGYWPAHKCPVVSARLVP